jgi:hypothetical protein
MPPIRARADDMCAGSFLAAEKEVRIILIHSIAVASNSHCAGRACPIAIPYV